MEHKGTVRIDTQRLTLRRFVLEDSPLMFRNWHNDEEVTKFLTWQAVRSITETESVLKDWIASYENPNFYQWAIVLKDINEPIGSISVVELHEKANKVQIGYAIGKTWWNKGITTEAFRSVIAFLFNEVGANRIEARHDPNNPGSGRVMQKSGLKYEATLRMSDWNNQGIVDISMYALLREEWKK